MKFSFSCFSELLILPCIHSIHLKVDVCCKISIFSLHFLWGCFVLVSSEIILFLRDLWLLDGRFSYFELRLWLLFRLTSSVMSSVGVTWYTMTFTYFIHAELSSLLRPWSGVFKCFVLIFSEGFSLFVVQLEFIFYFWVEFIEEIIGSGSVFAFNCSWKLYFVMFGDWLCSSLFLWS